MLENMADELQNTSQFFRRFIIPPDPLDAQIPRPGPYRFHSFGLALTADVCSYVLALNCQDYNLFEFPCVCGRGR